MDDIGELVDQYRQAKKDQATHEVRASEARNLLNNEMAKASAAWDHADMVRKALLTKLDETE